MREHFQIKKMKLPQPDVWSCDHVRIIENGEVDDVLGALCLSPHQEDAFYVCNLDVLVDKYRLWKRHLPRVQPHYAVKSNTSKLVLKTLAALGTGFDCASASEMEKVLSLGVDPSRIIFAHTAKPASHVRLAAAEGVNLATFDCEDELEKIKKHHPQCRLLIRIRCDAEKAYRTLGRKYGCEVEDVPRLLGLAKTLGLQVVGVAFHVGTDCQDAPALSKAICAASSVCRIGGDLGFNMSVLDIGGGFPGKDDHHFLEMARIVNSSIDEFFPLDVTVISEPGRFFVESAMTLATNVHSRRVLRDDKGDIQQVMYFINAGIYTGFMFQPKCEMRGTPLVTEKNPTLLPSSVWGPTCDSADMIEGPLHLPLLEIGSWLIYRQMGAYTASNSSEFNGFPVPKIHTVASRQTWWLLADNFPLLNECFYVDESYTDNNKLLIQDTRQREN